MVRNGDKISGYTVIAVANNIVLAHSETAPDSFVVWNADSDGVWGGKYMNNLEDAEWEFCSKAFSWFQDNVNITFDDEEMEKPQSGLSEMFMEQLRAARRELSEAAKAVDAMCKEMDRLNNGLKHISEEEKPAARNNVRVIKARVVL